MKKIESMSIKDFMTEKESKPTYKNSILIPTILLTSAIYFNAGDSVFAANSSIDQGGRAIYEKLLAVGEWIIIIKGGIDSINNVVQGDFQSAKKSFLSYLLVYVILHALPWATDQVDAVFSDM